MGKRVAGVAGGLSAVLVAWSCIEPQPAKVPDPARIAPARDALLGEPFDVAAIATEVAAFRGETVRGPVAFNVVNDGATRHHVIAYDELLPPVGGDALWRALAVAPPSDKTTAALPALFTTGLTALDVAKLADVWAPRPGETNDGQRTWALVHAVAHVLEEQNGMLPAPANAPDDDQAMARRALLEGDAELTTAAFIASRRPSGAHWLAQLLADVEKPTDRAGGSGAFGDLPRFAKLQWVFPYVDGFRLVASVYRVGGFALVDRMFERPPASTEQVLDPEKYVAGEPPVHLETPRAPDGYTPVVTETLGELRTRAWLAQCPGTRELGAASLGWGGDAMTVARDGLGRLVLLWSTVWDDPRSAERFEVALRTHPECSNPAGAPAPGDSVVLREGDRVAFVTGLASAPATTMARELLARPVVRAAATPPLGDVHLRAVESPRSFLDRGERVGASYVNKALGLSLPTSGLDVYAAAADTELTFDETFGLSTMEMTLYALVTAWSPALAQRTARDVVGGFEGAKGLPIDYLGETPIVTDAGLGHALRWFGREGTNEILVFVPVCDGKITLVAHGKGDGYGLWKETKRVLHGMRFDVTAPACRFVTADLPPPGASAPMDASKGQGVPASSSDASPARP